METEFLSTDAGRIFSVVFSRQGIGMQLRLCFGTYAQVLKKCKRNGVTQVVLGRAILRSINGETNPHYGDSSISDLFKGKKNVGPFEIEKARNGNHDDICKRFKEHVAPLLDTGKISLAVAAIRAIAREDDNLNSKSVIDPVGGLTKGDVASQVCFEPWSFLAGTLIFVVAEAKNSGARDDCKSVGDLFGDELSMEAAAITLVNAYDKLGVRSLRIWADGPSSLTVAEGDLFELVSVEERGTSKHIAVIPVDADFTTQITMSLEVLDEGGISPRSVHGIWLLSLMAGGMSKAELDERIISVLKRQGLNGNGVPMGTVSVVDLGATVYYLLAISRLDEDGNARSSKEDINLALSRLVDFYDKHGQGYPIYIPLMGTGLSRAHLTSRESYEAIRDVFTSNRDKVHGNVCIVVLPGSWDELGTDDPEEANAI